MNKQGLLVVLAVCAAAYSKPNYENRMTQKQKEIPTPHKRMIRNDIVLNTKDGKGLTGATIDYKAEARKQAKREVRRHQDKSSDESLCFYSLQLEIAKNTQLQKEIISCEKKEQTVQRTNLINAKKEIENLINRNKILEDNVKRLEANITAMFPPTTGHAVTRVSATACEVGLLKLLDDGSMVCYLGVSRSCGPTENTLIQIADFDPVTKILKVKYLEDIRTGNPRRSIFVPADKNCNRLDTY